MQLCYFLITQTSEMKSFDNFTTSVQRQRRYCNYSRPQNQVCRPAGVTHAPILAKFGMALLHAKFAEIGAWVGQMPPKLKIFNEILEYKLLAGAFPLLDFFYKTFSCMPSAFPGWCLKFGRIRSRSTKL